MSKLNSKQQASYMPRNYTQRIYNGNYVQLAIPSNQNNSLNSISKDANSQPSKLPTTKFRSISENNDIVTLCENLNNGSENLSSVSTSDLNLVMLYARETKIRLAFQGEYDKSENYEVLVNRMKQELSRRQQFFDQQSISSIEDNFKTANVEISNAHIENLQKFDNHTDQIITKKKSSQKAKMNQFKNQWESPKVNIYRKPSSKLLQLRSIERSAIISGDIITAKQVHKEIDQQIQEEMQEQKFRSKRDFRQQKKILADQMKKEMSNIVEDRGVKRKVMLLNQEHEKELIDKRKNVLLHKEISNRKDRSNCSCISSEYYAQSVSQMMNNNNSDFSKDTLLPDFSSVRDDSSNTTSQSKKESSLIIQPRNLLLYKFKWIQASSNDPKYRTEKFSVTPKLKKTSNDRSSVHKPKFTYSDHKSTNSKSIANLDTTEVYFDNDEAINNSSVSLDAQLGLISEIGSIIQSNNNNAQEENETSKPKGVNTIIDEIDNLIEEGKDTMLIPEETSTTNKKGLSRVDINNEELTEDEVVNDNENDLIVKVEELPKQTNDDIIVDNNEDLDEGSLNDNQFIDNSDSENHSSIIEESAGKDKENEMDDNVLPMFNDIVEQLNDNNEEDS